MTGQRGENSQSNCTAVNTEVSSLDATAEMNVMRIAETLTLRGEGQPRAHDGPKTPSRPGDSRQLKLEELADRVVDRTTPHARCDHGSERVVHDDDIRRRLGYLCTCDTHTEA